MLEKKEFEIPSEKFKKGATVYTDSDTPVKAAIIYFHGGGLLYGRRKDLLQRPVCTQSRDLRGSLL